MNKALTIIFVALLIVMGAATFIEHAEGTEYAQTTIYHSWWFFALWTMLALLSLIILIKRKIWRRPATGLLHLSFIVILLGAATSYFTGKEGVVHLRKGIAQQIYSDGKTNQILPFTLTLDSFVIDYYPGTNAPADFISYVSIGKAPLSSPKGDTLASIEGNFEASPRGGLEGAISMNNPLKFEGYRFFQSSFDRDLQGTVLSIKHDPWGIFITYTGYILLLLSIILRLLGGKVMRLLDRFASRLLGGKNSKPHNLITLTLCLISIGATARSLPTVSDEKAEQMARMQVIYNDRIAPFNTLAQDIVKKIYGSDSYHGLSAEQVVYGWIARPDVWKDEPLIKIKDSRLREELGIKGNYACLSELTKHIDKLASTPSYRSVDEKVGILLMLANGTLIKPLPKDVAPLTKERVEAEILYNAIPFNKIMFMYHLSLGIIAFILFLWNQRTGKMKTAMTLLKALSCVSLAFISAYYLLRWYIGGRIPMGNGYETMLFMSLCIMLISVVMQRRTIMFTPFGFLLSGFTMLVAHLSDMNPQITPLMPVLSSPLLTLHVSVIMMAYALLSFTALLSLWGLINSSTHQLINLSTKITTYAVLLLAIGIFLGAVWANVSWGRYWGWDPKEVWALITLLVYSVPLHRKSIKLLQNPKYYHLYMLLAFLTVLMTYFGVNYFLGGMHSYA